MMKNTKLAIVEMLNEIKKIGLWIKYGSIAISFIYFIIAIITKTGNQIANILSASLFVIYTIFELVTKNIERKQIKKVIKKIYVWLRILIRAFALATIIYGIYTQTEDVSPLSVIFLTLMIILWILQVLFEIVITIISRYVNRVITEIKRDYEEFKDTSKTYKLINTVKTIKDKFKKHNKDDD